MWCDALSHALEFQSEDAHLVFCLFLSVDDDDDDDDRCQYDAQQQ